MLGFKSLSFCPPSKVTGLPRGLDIRLYRKTLDSAHIGFYHVYPGMDPVIFQSNYQF